MRVDDFLSERWLSTWQNRVRYDFTETGVHPLYLHELITAEELLDLHGRVQLRYVQTNGIPALKDAVTRLYPGATPKHVLVTNGSAEANYVAVWSRVEPGDEVVVIYPNYLQVPGVARGLGATVRRVSLREETGWALDLDELAAHVGPRTRLIYLSNPNNPTGALLSAAEMAAIARSAERVGAWILADEVYRGAELDGEPSPSFWGMSERVLIVGGLSKAYTLPGLRIGWLVGPPDVVARAWGYHDYTTITTGALNSELAIVAMRDDVRHRILARNRAISARNLAALRSWLAEHSDLFRFIPPRIGGVAFVGYNLEISSLTIVNRLLEDHSVLIVPGEAFGLDGFVRIGYGHPQLLEGLPLISAVLTAAPNA